MYIDRCDMYVCILSIYVRRSDREISVAPNNAGSTNGRKESERGETNSTRTRQGLGPPWGIQKRSRSHAHARDILLPAHDLFSRTAPQPTDSADPTHARPRERERERERERGRDRRRRTERAHRKRSTEESPPGHAHGPPSSTASPARKRARKKKKLLMLRGTRDKRTGEHAGGTGGRGECGDIVAVEMEMEMEMERAIFPCPARFQGAHIAVR